jgi:hypothetical protein
VLAKQGLYFLSHNSSPSCSGHYGVGGFRTICPSQPWTMILLTSASQVSRITLPTWVTSTQLRFWIIKSIEHKFYSLGRENKNLELREVDNGSSASSVNHKKIASNQYKIYFPCLTMLEELAYDRVRWSWSRWYLLSFCWISSAICSFFT